MVEIPKSYVGLKRQYNDLPEDTKKYLSKLDTLFENGNNFEIALAYCFIKLEEGHHRALKCGLVRLHECDSGKTESELEKQHFTQEYYRTIFKKVFSSDIPKPAIECLVKAQTVRNSLIHGKATTDAKRRDGIHYSLEYMRLLGEFVQEKTNKNPFGDLRGLQGKKKLIAPKSTVWMLKGFGIGSKELTKDEAS